MITSQDLLDKGFAAISCARFYAGYPNGLELESETVKVSTKKDLDLLSELVLMFNLNVKKILFDADVTKFERRGTAITKDRLCTAYRMTDRVLIKSAFYSDFYHYRGSMCVEVEEFRNKKIMKRTLINHLKDRVVHCVTVAGITRALTVFHCDGIVTKSVAVSGKHDGVSAPAYFTYLSDGYVSVTCEDGDMCCVLEPFKLEMVNDNKSGFIGQGFCSYFMRKVSRRLSKWT